MKISLSWLNQYVDVEKYFENPKALDDKLTHAGLEVEDIDDRAKPYQNVVVGHIIEKGQHPDADRLSLCQVDVGGKSPQQIICGASNHKQGDKVVVALPGAVLPGDFAIKKSKIRGVESLGMLCSETELGLGESSEGIIILPVDAPVGESFAKYYELDDIVLELSVTPNRADCLSHFGLAREVSCLDGVEYKVPLKEKPEISESTRDHFQLEVKATDVCPRYCGRLIRNVQVKESPSWLKNRLESVGMKSINNIVDVTNYVMLELGQPLHAFDANEINGSKILVDYSQEGEKFITLDGSEIELTGKEVMIRDAEKPVALAGVVGGVNSGVTDETTNIFLESAYFTMSSVRKTARSFGIETDSAYRFSRGVDPEGTFLAMQRASELIQEVAGGELLSDPYDNYPSPIKAKSVEVRINFVAQKLGYEVSSTQFVDWMNRLGCQVEKKDENIFQVTPPAFRGDLNIEEDFIEEFARLHGYSEIPETLPQKVDEPTEHHSMFLHEQFVHKNLQGMGFQQAVNFAFTNSVTQSEFLGFEQGYSFIDHGFDVSGESVFLKNPISEELNVMRQSLLPRLVEVAAENDRKGNSLGKLYEVGATFCKTDKGYHESSQLGFVMWGKKERLWSENVPLVYELKSEVENFLFALKSRSWSWRVVQKEQVPSGFHPAQFAHLFFEGKVVGYIGTLHPLWNEKLKFKSPCAIAEFNFEKLMQGQPRPVKSKSLSKYQKVERDLAFVMPRELAVGDVTAEIRRVIGGKLIDVFVFDLYEGEKVGAGQKSVAFRMILQGKDETLSDDQILGLQEKVINSVSQKFSISVR